MHNRLLNNEHEYTVSVSLLEMPEIIRSCIEESLSDESHMCRNSLRA